jgi:oxygen-independent coproporphyrinogen-3 oxidase
MPQEPIGLYIHIPFCQTKCIYCNFNTYARLEHLIPEYVRALCHEMQMWGELLEQPAVRTIFLGGGTPSLLPESEITHVLDAARKSFSVARDAEVTLEANPGDITEAKLSCWKALGVNRLSMGVQSFDDGELQMLTRRHTAHQAKEAYRRMKGAGFENVSFDLIYGLPGQSLETWRRTLEQSLGLEPVHISLYGLTIEEGTPLKHEVESGRLPKPDPDLAADMYLLAEEMLKGYRHYEISNWAKPGYEARHNLIYWRNEPFLGVGPGAHSYLRGKRFWNIKSPPDYIRRLTADTGARWPFDEMPTVEEWRATEAKDEAAETAILKLRLDEGLAIADIGSRFGEAEARRQAAVLRGFVGHGLVTESDGFFRLTSQGRLLSNEIFVKLLPEES